MLVGVGHSLCAVALVYFLLQFQAPAFDDSTVEMLSEPLAMLGLALAAPILEEYLYRGVILESYRRYLPFWAAAGLSALLFAVSHLNWQQGIHAFLLGLWTAYLCRRTGRMLYPVLAHMTNNCLSGLASIAATLLDAGAAAARRPWSFCWQWAAVWWRWACGAPTAAAAPWRRQGRMPERPRRTDCETFVVTAS